MVELIPAVQEFASSVGIAKACTSLGPSRPTFYRQIFPKRDTAKKMRQRQPPALSEAERKAVLDALNSDRFVYRSPAETYAALLDEGVYLLHCACTPISRPMETMATIETTADAFMSRTEFREKNGQNFGNSHGSRLDTLTTSSPFVAPGGTTTRIFRTSWRSTSVALAPLKATSTMPPEVAPNSSPVMVTVVPGTTLAGNTRAIFGVAKDKARSGVVSLGRTTTPCKNEIPPPPISTNLSLLLQG